MKTETLAVLTPPRGSTLRLASPRDDDGLGRSLEGLNPATPARRPLQWQEVCEFAEWLAGIKASQIIGKAGLRRSDFEDVRQSLLLYVIEHLGEYDPRRGLPQAFASMLITTAVAMLLRRRRQMKRGGGRPPMSLDAIAGSHNPGPVQFSSDARSRRLGLLPRDDQDATDERLDLAAAVSSLRGDLRALASLFAQGHTVASIARLSGRSRRHVYRDVDALRSHLTCAGLNPGAEDVLAAVPPSAAENVGQAIL